MEDIKEKVLKHEFAIDQLAATIEDLANNAKETNRKLGQIVESMGKQEVILEKLASIDARTKDSFNRVHTRIDENHIAVKEAITRINSNGCEAYNGKCNTYETVLNDTIDRVGVLEGTVRWVSRTIIGTLLTGSIGLLFFIIKHKF